MKKLFKTLSALVFASILGVNFEANAQNIAFSSNELYPEGVAYSLKQDAFFVTSLRYGKIGKLDRKGTYTEFINDNELVSTIGTHADPKRNLLYVCVSDPGVSVKTNAATQGKLGKVIAYDLTTGKRKFSTDLGVLNPTGGNFANDVAFDTEGNLYVTNSFSPMIFKVTPEGKGSIFATSDLFKGEGFSLNGIVFHKNGYLIVAHSGTGNLYKISLKNPKEITKINATPISGADGLVIKGKNLIVISNEKKEIYQLVSKDDFASATLKKKVASEMTFPTTGVIAKGKLYVLNAKLDELFNPKVAKTSNFLLQEIALDEKKNGKKGKKDKKSKK